MTKTTGLFHAHYKIAEEDHRLKEYIETLNPTDELITLAYLNVQKGKYESILELRQVLSSFKTAQKVQAIGTEVKKIMAKTK